MFKYSDVCDKKWIVTGDRLWIKISVLKALKCKLKCRQISCSNWLSTVVCLCYIYM